MSDRADPRTDPVGARLDFLADAIVEFRPGGRRRLTVDWRVARELAEYAEDAQDAYEAMRDAGAHAPAS